jgi:dynein heavy chain 1
VKSSTPILLCSVPGFDASDRIDDLATQQGKYLTSIAIGSAEGFSEADKAILASSKTGRWVMLKNVHLAPQWLVQLEKKLHSLTPHSSFRLFLTLEINPKVPVNLLRTSRILVFEPPPGIKANLIRTFSSVSASRMNKEPNERSRLYFLLAWLHAIVQERLRYVPLGWSKKYEFNEPDLKMGCDTLDTWIENVAQGRTNIPPAKIPWDAFKTLLSQCIYGGRIDNDFDQRLLTSFVDRLFTVESFEHDFALVHNVDGTSKSITIPDGSRREQFIDWISQLPDTQTPSWLGLPNNAEKVLLTTRGNDMVAKLLRMQNLDLEDDVNYSSVDESRDMDGRPSWMRSLSISAAQWLSVVPESLDPLKRTTENIKDPLFRFYEREVNNGLRLLRDVRAGLSAVLEACDGTRKLTNDLRFLISDLAKGIIPKSWCRYSIPADLTVIQWVVDFSKRIKQLQKVVKAAGSSVIELKRIQVWLGGLFIPEAFVTASRQYVAQANNWSLEELHLQVEVSDPGKQPPEVNDRSFPVVGK